MFPDQKQLFESLFSQENLLNAFESKYLDANSRGIDRRNGESFAKEAIETVSVASAKCLSGTYAFSPYLELLKIKDRTSPPRLISIPTIRDRIVLTQLNSYIRAHFPNETKLLLASDYIKKVTELFANLDRATTWTAGLDIKKFYDSINRERLRKIIENRLSYKPAVSLILKAISTPTVPKNYRTKDKSKYISGVGIPQGLAISNSLAALYVNEIDEPMRAMGINYFRFVDDVLLIGNKESTARAARSFMARARARGLSVYSISSKKGHHLPLGVRFSYLGYEFEYPLVTVRGSTIERLLHGVAAKISDYKYNKGRILAAKAYLTSDTLRAAFVDELNERITGAISGNRRYGWIAYFSQITDMTVLHKIDLAVEDMIKRIPDFSDVVLKKISRAYYEMKFRPHAGYVRNYDEFKTVAQKLEFLAFRGQISKELALTEFQINEKFEAYRQRQLNQMLADEASIY